LVKLVTFTFILDNFWKKIEKKTAAKSTVFFPIVFTEKKSLTVHRQTNKSFASTLSKPIVEPITLLL